jgi:hypothetical protein
MGADMLRTVILALCAALTAHSAAAHVVRHGSIPEAYRGTWAPTSATCKDADKAAIVLSAKAYAGPAGSCIIDYVSETAEPRGSTFSARMQCSNPQGQAQKKTIANLIMRPDGADRISVGPGFESLKAYQRCSAGEPGTKQ